MAACSSSREIVTRSESAALDELVEAEATVGPLETAHAGCLDGRLHGHGNARRDARRNSLLLVNCCRQRCRRVKAPFVYHLGQQRGH